jgi:hypothetical protein
MFSRTHLLPLDAPAVLRSRFLGGAAIHRCGRSLPIGGGFSLRGTLPVHYLSLLRSRRRTPIFSS